MKHVKLGDLDVSRIGLGAMGMSAAYTGAGTDDAGSTISPRRPATITRKQTCDCSAADPKQPLTRSRG